MLRKSLRESDEFTVPLNNLMALAFGWLSVTEANGENRMVIIKWLVEENSSQWIQIILSTQHPPIDLLCDHVNLSSWTV